jgi:hypothetical protein
VLFLSIKKGVYFSYTLRSWAPGRWEGEALLLVTAENAASGAEMIARWQALGARVATQPVPGATGASWRCPTFRKSRAAWEPGWSIDLKPARELGGGARHPCLSARKTVR